MLEPEDEHGRPPGGPPSPPAPPGTGGVGGHPDPRDPGPPITVQLGELLLGDLGNRTVDGRLLGAILLRDGAVARWLVEQCGIDASAVEAAFPTSGWPLDESSRDG